MNVRKTRSRQLRKDQTKPEQIVWNVLRNRRLGGLKFRRQHPIGPYIVDFFCHEVGLVVEVDGESHEGQRYLKAEGYRVFRVLNDDILEDIEAVARGIAKAAGLDISKW